MNATHQAICSFLVVVAVLLTLNLIVTTSGHATATPGGVAVADEPTGACCFDGTCDVITLAQCDALEGNYVGDDITCASVDCTFGACCYVDMCYESDEFECPGNWYPGSTCEQAPECFWGACCLPSGQCFQLFGESASEPEDLCTGLLDGNYHPFTRCEIIGECPVAPTCPGDTDGDGVVNVDDLVEVILHWGESCI